MTRERSRIFIKNFFYKVTVKGASNLHKQKGNFWAPVTGQKRQGVQVWLDPGCSSVAQKCWFYALEDWLIWVSTALHIPGSKPVGRPSFSTPQPEQIVSLWLIGSDWAIYTFLNQSLREGGRLLIG